jgi:hypothetical protein
MQNQFNKMSVCECQIISENIYKARRIQGHSSTSLQIQGYSRP